MIFHQMVELFILFPRLSPTSLWKTLITVLYLWPYSIGLHPDLMTTGKSWKIDKTV